MKKLFLLMCLSTLMACEPAMTFAQGKGRAKKTAATSSALGPCGSFSFNIIGDNHVAYPLSCNDSVVFEVRCAMANENYYLRFPVNIIRRSGGDVIAWGGVRFTVDATGSARIVWNYGDCFDGVLYHYAPTPPGYDVDPGTYKVELYWWGAYNPSGSADIVIE